MMTRARRWTLLAGVPGTMPALAACVLGLSACDTGREAITAEPAATAGAVASAAAAAASALAGPVAAPSATAPPPGASAVEAPAPAGSATAAEAGGTTTQAAASTKQPPSPAASADARPNPCVAHYEDRVGPDGQVTRTLVPRNPRCDYKGEGGITKNGAYLGY